MIGGAKKALVKAYNRSKRFIGLKRKHNGIGLVNYPKSSKKYLKQSFSQQGEDLSLDRIWSRVLNNKFIQKGFYVDMGSYHPIEHSVTYLMYLRGWKGLVIDASKKSCELHKIERPRDIVINAVVGEHDMESVNFYYSKSNQLSLINTKYPSSKNKYNKVSLPQKNINTILKSKGINTIDFLNIDIEGAELEVLETLNFDKYKPKIIAVEIHGNDIAKGLNTDIAKKLLEMNYILLAVNVITYFFCRSN